MYRAIWTTPIPAPRSQQSVSQRSTYRTLGSDELRQRMNSHWDQGRLLVSCDLAWNTWHHQDGQFAGNIYSQQKKQMSILAIFLEVINLLL